MNTSAAEHQIKMSRAAASALRLAQDKVVANMRFMDPAVYELKLSEATEADAAPRGIRTDGSVLFYGAEDVVRRARSGLPELTHAYMHVLLHCIFRHHRVRGHIRRAAWDLAADIAVEEVIASFRMECLETANAPRIREELIMLRRNIGSLTAERIYRYLLNNALPEKRLRTLEELFHFDNHEKWYSNGLPLIMDEDEDGEPSETEEDGEGAGMPDDDGEDEGTDPETEPDWEKISQMVKAAIEAGEGAEDADSGRLLENLRSHDRKTMDYSTFLRKFASRKEALKVDDSTFDYIFYTYGLELYGDMPLVEPLEYSDEPKVRDLVIVIDSSASTQGELVESFVFQTFDILLNANEFSSRFNIRLIQCDSEIQEDINLNTRRDAEEYLRGMEIKGMGGTDFRTAFRYVDDLVLTGAFTDLRGLIYFTDGNGTFPKQKPAYETAFVFADEESAGRVKVPPWAIKAVLSD